MTQPLHDEGDPEAYAGDEVPDPWDFPDDSPRPAEPTIMRRGVTDGEKLDPGSVPAEPQG